MQTTAINGHPSNARKSQRVTCIHRLARRCAIILGTFSGVLPDFWVPFLAIPGFWGIIVLVQFDFFRNNPDFWVLILIFYFK